MFLVNDEIPKAREFDRFSFFEMAFDDFEDLLNNLGRFFFRKADRLGNMLNNVCFCHTGPHHHPPAVGGKEAFNSYHGQESISPCAGATPQVADKKCKIV